MFLDVSVALKNPGCEYPFHAEETIAPQEISGDEITFDTAVLNGVMCAEEETVTLTGTLKTVVHTRCANCLNPAQCEILAQFDENFLHGGDPDDNENFSYEGSRIDLEKLTLSVTLLEMPMRILCKEDCRGLLEQYSADDNIDATRKELPTQRPFAALQQLLTTAQESSEKDDSQIGKPHGQTDEDEEV